MLRDPDPHGFPQFPQRDPREVRMERWAVVCGVLTCIFGIPAALVLFALWAGL